MRIFIKKNEKSRFKVLGKTCLKLTGEIKIKMDFCIPIVIYIFTSYVYIHVFLLRKIIWLCIFLICLYKKFININVYICHKKYKLHFNESINFWMLISWKLLNRIHHIFFTIRFFSSKTIFLNLFHENSQSRYLNYIIHRKQKYIITTVTDFSRKSFHCVHHLFI